MRISSATSVDLPEPEGAEMMKTVVIPREFSALLFKIERLLADFFDRGLGGQRQFRNLQRRLARPAGLGKDRIGFAIHLLQQKVEFLAGLSSRIQKPGQLSGVNLQARQLLLDIAAIGQEELARLKIHSAQL